MLDALAQHGAAVLVAPPGAGKTTLVPPALLDAPWAGDGVVLLVQPRRMAARALARRLASQLDERVGETVGYQVRFERVGGPQTRLWVLTEGVLTRRLQADPELEAVAAVVLDEFHERSLHADLSLALLREVREALRDDLRLLVMSATLDPGPLAAFLDDCPVVQSEGRAFPVHVRHIDHELPVRRGRAARDVVPDAMARETLGMLEALARDGEIGRGVPGTVLGFLPGVREIEQAVARTRASVEAGVEVLPLHGRLDPADQDRALVPASGTRVVFATTIAETSLTLPGVVGVVDAGLVRRPAFDPPTGLSRLVTERVSRAGADQRAGRAGRVRPGRALRLWTPAQHSRLSAFAPAEIARVDLAELVLQLKRWGVADVTEFVFFEAPRPAALREAEALLVRLGLLHRGGLTALGERVARIPAHPRLGRMLVEAAAHGDASRRLAAEVAACLSEGRRPPDAAGRARGCDLVAMVRQERAGPARRRLAQVAAQLSRAAPPASSSSPSPPEEGLGRSVLAAWPDRLAQRRAPGTADLRVQMANGGGAELGRATGVTDDALLVAIDLGASEAPGRAPWVRAASRVEPGWVRESPSLERRREVRWVSEREQVSTVEVVAWAALELEARVVKTADAAAAAQVLLQAASEAPARTLPTERKARATTEAMLGRLMLLSVHQPELELPVGCQALVMAGLHRLVAGRRSFEELRRAPWAAALRDGFGWEVTRALDTMVPERLSVPSGSLIRIDYQPVVDETGPPVLAVKVQEVFGLVRSPSLCGGRVPVVLHLLDPAGRPLQITRDLASFWTSTWASVRGEMRSRYPKHRWPEDPTSAEASRRTTQRRRRP